MRWMGAHRIELAQVVQARLAFAIQILNSLLVFCCDDSGSVSKAERP